MKYLYLIVFSLYLVNANELFNKYGNGSVITREGFQKLFSDLQKKHGGHSANEVNI
jgi:hypothetical protein